MQPSIFKHLNCLFNTFNAFRKYRPDTSFLCIIALLFAIGISAPAKASHIVGGNLQMEYMGNSDYRFTLMYFRDVLNGSAASGFSSEVNVSIYRKRDNQFVRQLTLYKSGTDSVLAPSFRGCESYNFKISVIQFIGYDKLEVQDFSELGGYYIASNMCCRNSAISNIRNPGQSGNTFTLDFPALIGYDGYITRNSSPAFKPFKADYGCIDKEFYIDFSATDKDGDSLAYALTDPYNSQSRQTTTTTPPAPYQNINWVPGYSGLYPINSRKLIKIDPVTGILAVLPVESGLFVLTVEVKEYRKGRLIGNVRRDYQVLILACPGNYAPHISLDIKGQTQTALTGPADTIHVTTKPGLDDFKLSFTDSTANEYLSVKIVPVNYTGDLFSISPSSGSLNNRRFTASLNLPDCVQDPAKIYIFDVIVSDNDCPLHNTVTRRIAVKYVPPPVNRPYISVSGLPVNGAPLEITPFKTQSFLLTASIADTNALHLSIDSSDGFSPALLGINFRDTSGYRSISVPLSINVTCEGIKAYNGRTIKLRLKAGIAYTCPEVPNADTTIILNIKDGIATLSGAMPGNVLTPNGDGLDDCFSLAGLPEGSCLDPFSEIKIYNRWGKPVFSNTRNNFCWDGAGMPAGVYYYTLHFGISSAGGSISLIR